MSDASKNITKKIKELGDWRGKMLAHLRKLIHAADPEIQEEWKWMGTPVWAHEGGVCTGESYKQVVKLTFFRGLSPFFSGGGLPAIPSPPRTTGRFSDAVDDQVRGQERYIDDRGE